MTLGSMRGYVYCENYTICCLLWKPTKKVSRQTPDERVSFSGRCESRSSDYQACTESICIDCIDHSFPAALPARKRAKHAGAAFELSSFRIEPAGTAFDIRPFHEDDRAKYFFGALKWTDPSYNPKSYSVVSIIALHKVADESSPPLAVKRFEAEIYSATTEVVRLKASELQYFNTVLLPALRVKFPYMATAPRESLQVMGYAIGHQFEDTDDFFKSRADRRILPEQPLYGTGRGLYTFRCLLAYP